MRPSEASKSGNEEEETTEVFCENSDFVLKQLSQTSVECNVAHNLTGLFQVALSVLRSLTVDLI